MRQGSSTGRARACAVLLAAHALRARKRSRQSTRPACTKKLSCHRQKIKRLWNASAPAEMIVGAAGPISHLSTSVSSEAIVDHDPFSVNYNDSATNGAGAIREAANALPVEFTQDGEDFQDLSQPRFVRIYTAVKIYPLFG